MAPDSRQYSSTEIRTIALAIIAGVFFGGVATGVAYPTLPLLDDHLLITAVMLSIILSANRIARLVMNTPAGAIVDRYGARKPMIVGLYVQALAPFGYIVGLHTPSVVFGTVPVIGEVSAPGVVFVLARLFWGFGSAFVFIGAFAIINYVTTVDNRGTWLGYMRGGQSLGFPSGLVLGGVLTDVAGMQEAFLAGGILALIAGTVATLVLPRVHTTADTTAARVRDIPGIIRARPAVAVIGFGNFTLQFLWGGVLLTTLARYAEVHGLEMTLLEAAGISGIAFALGILTSGVTTVIAGPLSDRLSNRATLTTPAFVLIGAGFLVAAFVPGLVPIVIAVVLMGIGMGAAAPILLAILGDLTPGDELGRTGGVYNTMGDIGLSLGPLVGIPASETLGFATTYAAGAALVFSCVVIVSLPLLRQPDLLVAPATAE